MQETETNCQVRNPAVCYCLGLQGHGSRSVSVFCCRSSVSRTIDRWQRHLMKCWQQQRVWSAGWQMT